MPRFAIKCLLAILLSFAAAPAAFSQPLNSNAGSRVKVYLLRGLTNVLSPGIDQLAAELRQRGIESDITNHLLSGSLADEAIEDCKSGRVTTIVLVGHSLGASAAASMAEQLQRAGVHVALIVMFDPVVKTAIPGNVHLVENFYLSNGVGTAVEPGERFRGALENVDLKDDPGVGHVSLTTLPSLHRHILRDILAAANIRCG
jgi:methylmalonyl-CoA mutase cobalamin-binding subunit